MGPYIVLTERIFYSTLKKVFKMQKITLSVIVVTIAIVLSLVIDVSLFSQGSFLIARYVVMTTIIVMLINIMDIVRSMKHSHGIIFSYFDFPSSFYFDLFVLYKQGHKTIKEGR